ncbi:hypothetical protein B0J11DRAFT_532265 [Dendryphion nanum]|uniref:Uncharacterized protein n=1 Tax=Dendryphion nanum TaxID=256645 RepID=A0A9P9DPR8_9PLEO|nr:hypothetical protein B0J11DRAFT_532265 [Dendryphion nanum]
MCNSHELAQLPLLIALTLPPPSHSLISHSPTHQLYVTYTNTNTYENETCMRPRYATARRGSNGFRYAAKRIGNMVRRKGEGLVAGFWGVKLGM